MSRSTEAYSCQRCGHCCQGEHTVSISGPERQAMAAFLGIDLAAFLKGYCRQRGGWVEMRTVDVHCIFFGRDGLCAVHPVKPVHCRKWPLHPSILADPAAWEAIRADCPGFAPDVTYEEACGLVRRAQRGA